MRNIYIYAYQYEQNVFCFEGPLKYHHLFRLPKKKTVGLPKTRAKQYRFSLFKTKQGRLS